MRVPNLRFPSAIANSGAPPYLLRKTLYSRRGAELSVFERELLEGFRRGERWALRRVCESTWTATEEHLEQGFVFGSGSTRIRFRGLRDRDERHDVLADVYAVAFEPAARAGYDGERPYLPYLLQIARNKVIDRFRGRSREYEILEQVATQSSLAEAPANAEGALLADEESAHARDYLKELPERERMVFELRIAEELPRDEVERRTGLSASQIRTNASSLGS